jgi:glucose-6-phosphate dehydrogenase assembly protein OpcA
MSAGATSLKPDNILHELSELWTSLSRKEAGAPGATGVLRACAMTLIVFVDDESDAMALGETLIQLMHGHPSRAIVVRLRGDAGVLACRVFEQCWTPFGHHQQICCEQIEFSVSLNRVADVPSIIAPLAAADMPRVIWFRAARMEQVSNIGEILPLGDKMIFDSSRPGSPTFADLRVLANAGYIVADLCWTRLTRLRELIAQLLDGRELKSITEVTIEYPGKDAPPHARYLQAWLRSTLTAADIQLLAADQPDTSSPGSTRLKRIRIEPDIIIEGGANCAEYEIGGMRQRANLPDCSETDLLSEELSIMGRDRVFESALQRMTPWTPLS